MVETRDSDHASEMLEELRKHYKKLSFTSAMGSQAYDSDDDDSDSEKDSGIENGSFLAVKNGDRRRSSIKISVQDA